MSKFAPWLTVIFAMLSTAGAYGLAIFLWKQSRSWLREGVVDNGFGYRIEKSAKPLQFRIACRMNQSIAVFGFFLVLIGLIATGIAIARAL